MDKRIDGWKNINTGRWMKEWWEMQEQRDGRYRDWKRSDELAGWLAGWRYGLMDGCMDGFDRRKYWGM